MRDYKARPGPRARKPLRGMPPAFRRRKEAPPKGFTPLRPPEPARPERPSRIAAAARGVRRWPLRSVLFGAAAAWAVAGLCVGGWALATAPLQEVTLEGRVEVPADTVLSLAGLSAGLSLLDVDPYETARRIDTHPRIVATDVRRRFPGRLSIRVRERQPDLRVVLPDGRVALIDRDNVVLHLLPPGAPLDDPVQALPVVRGVRAAAMPSEPLNSVAIRRARAALVAIRELGVPAGAPVSLDTGEAFRLQLRLADGRRLILPYDNLERALRTYQALADRYPQVLESMHAVDLTPLATPGAARVVLRRR